MIGKIKDKNKGIAALLCLVLIITMITGCSVPVGKEKKDSNTSKNNEKTISENESENEESWDDEGKIEDYDSLESKGTLKNISEMQYRELEDYSGVTIEKQVLVDQNGILITALEYVYDPTEGEGILISLENNMEKAIDVDIETCIINNYHINAWLDEEVAPGETMSKIIAFPEAEMAEASIGEVGQIEIAFEVDEVEVAENIFTTELAKIQTSAYATMDNAPVSDGVELYNENGVRIVGLYSYNDFGTDNIILYIENASEKEIYVDFQDGGVNGIVMDPYFSTKVFAEKKVVEELEFASSDLEDNNIEKIEDIELDFVIYDAKTQSILGFSGMNKLDME